MKYAVKIILFARTFVELKKMAFVQMFRQKWNKLVCPKRHVTYNTLCYHKTTTKNTFKKRLTVDGQGASRPRWRSNQPAGQARVQPVRSAQSHGDQG